MGQLHSAMQTRVQARADQTAQANALSLGHEVLTNALILSQLWGLIEVDDKRQLLRACRLVRSQASELVTVLSMEGATEDLSMALARFPQVTCLTVPCRLECLLVLGAAKQAPRLQQLRLRNELHDVAGLAPLASCAQLRRLDMNGVQLQSLEGIQAFSSLEYLNIACCRSLTSISPLSSCRKLKTLKMNCCSAVTGIGPLSACCELQVLSAQCCKFRGIAPLSACLHLQVLDIHHCYSVRSLAPLSACPQLKTLDIRGCNNVESIEPLLACVELEDLAMDSYRHVEVEALRAALPQLRINS